MQSDSPCSTLLAPHANRRATRRSFASGATKVVNTPAEEEVARVITRTRTPRLPGAQRQGLTVLDGGSELADTVQKLILKRLKEKLGVVAVSATAPAPKNDWHYCPRGHPLCDKTHVCWVYKWCPEKAPAPQRNPDVKQRVLDIAKTPVKNSVDGDRSWSALAARNPGLRGQRLGCDRPCKYAERPCEK